MADIKKAAGCTCFNVEKVAHLRKLAADAEFGTITRVYKALGHPRRMLTLYLIGKGELCVCDLAQTMNAPVPTVSQYLRILKDAGLIYDEQNHKFLIYKLTDLGKRLLGGSIDE